MIMICPRAASNTWTSQDKWKMNSNMKKQEENASILLFKKWLKVRSQSLTALELILMTPMLNQDGGTFSIDFCCKLKIGILNCEMNV